MWFVFYDRVPLRAGLNFTICIYICAPVADRDECVYFYTRRFEKADGACFGVYRGRKEQIMSSALPRIAVSASLATQIGRRGTHMQRTEDFYSSATVALLIGF